MELIQVIVMISITFCVAVGYFIGPFAAIALRTESQAFGTGEVEANTVHTVSERTAVPSITQFEVPKLMRTILSRLSGL